MVGRRRDSVSPCLGQARRARTVPVETLLSYDTLLSLEMPYFSKSEMSPWRNVRFRGGGTGVCGDFLPALEGRWALDKRAS